MERMSGQLFETPPSRPTDDYLDLPKGVMPTTMAVLEQAGDILFIKKAAHERGYSPKQKQIFDHLVEIGNGRTWVVVLWGSPGNPRAIEVFSPDGYEKPRPCDTTDVRRWVSDWFFTRRSNVS